MSLPVGSDDLWFAFSIGNVSKGLDQVIGTDMPSKMFAYQDDFIVIERTKEIEERIPDTEGGDLENKHG